MKAAYFTREFLHAGRRWAHRARRGIPTLAMAAEEPKILEVDEFLAHLESAATAQDLAAADDLDR